MPKPSEAEAARGYDKIERIQSQLELLQEQLTEQQKLLVDQQRVVSKLLEEIAQAYEAAYFFEAS